MTRTDLAHLVAFIYLFVACRRCHLHRLADWAAYVACHRIDRKYGMGTAERILS